LFAQIPEMAARPGCDTPAAGGTVCGAGPVERLIAEGALALWQDGDLRSSRMLFEGAYQRAQRCENPSAMASAALGLSGLWVHEYQSLTAAAVTLDRLRRAARTAQAAQDDGLALRLRARLAAETDHRSAGHAAMLAVVEQARRTSDPVVLAEALNLARQCLMDPAASELRRHVTRDLLAVSAHTRRRGDLLLGTLWGAIDLILDGSPDAERSVAGLRALLSSRRHLAVDYRVRAIEVMLEIRAGRLEPAERRAERCAAAGRAAGQSAAATWHAAHLIAIRWYQGRVGELVPMIRKIAAAPNLSPVDYSFQAWLALASAAAGENRDAAAALAGLTGHGQSLAAIPRSGSWLVAMYGIVEAGYLLGQREIAEQAYRLLLPYAALPATAGPAVSCFGSVEHALGLARLTLGDPRGAADHLTRAVTHNTALGHFPAATLARARLAHALTHSPDPAQRNRAGQEAATAHHDAHDLGMTLPPTPTPPTPSPHGAAPRHPATATATGTGAPTCRRHGRHWQITAAGRTIHVDHCRGLTYLAVLLANPGTEIPALELTTTPHPIGIDAGVVDGEATIEYRERLKELQQEIERCDAVGDQAGAIRAHAERDMLLARLRPTTDSADDALSPDAAEERARIAVGKAIRRALARIIDADPQMGALLSASIHTGRRCIYLPLEG